MSNKWITSFVELISIIAVIFTAFFWLNSEFVHARDFKAVEQRLDYHIQSDALSQKQNRLWRLEEKYGKDCERDADRDTRKEFRELKEDVERSKDRVKKLESEIK